MNNFSTIDAQCGVSSLAVVRSDEVSFDVPVVAARGLNVDKLVLHNLTQPILRRISRTALAAKVRAARHRGNMVALWATIHAECEPQRLALRQQEAALEAASSTRSNY